MVTSHTSGELQVFARRCGKGSQKVNVKTATGSSLMGECRLFPVEDKGPLLELHHFTLYHPHLLALWFLDGTAFNYL